MKTCRGRPARDFRGPLGRGNRADCEAETASPLAGETPATRGTPVFIHVLIVAALAGLAGLAGCASPQPYLTRERLDRGLVMVFTGIEGRSPFNGEIVRGLAEGGVDGGIELVDWTWHVPGAYLVSLRTESRNRAKAEDLAGRITLYKVKHPGRPVVLVGQSGGAAMAVWAAEYLAPTMQVDGIILLAAALSPDYPLEAALARSDRGIVSFCSQRDFLFLGAGTQVFATMDGKHVQSAGKVGFTVPADSPQASLYRRLFQVQWDEQMEKAGHSGWHMTSGAGGFVRQYVAPLVRSPKWDRQVLQQVLNGATSAPATAPASGHASDPWWRRLWHRLAG